MPLNHLAIIMDGNRRWAVSKNLKPYEGHVKGADNLWQIISDVEKCQISFLTVFVFSTENWKRSESEISFLMSLLSKFLDDIIDKNSSNSYRIRFIGDLASFKKQIIKKINVIERNTKNNNGLTITIALNYGGRYDIVEAVRKILNSNSLSTSINENLFKSFTFNKNIPDPDLLIRTGGELRLSNFLLWDLAYTELMFVKEMWPEFDGECLIRCLKDYNKRIRKYGGDN